jgi:hypothetical protein
MHPLFVLFIICFFLMLGISISPRSHTYLMPPYYDVNRDVNRRAWLYVIILGILVSILFIQLNDLSNGKLWVLFKKIVEEYET